MKAKPIGPPLWRPCPNTPPCPHSDFAHDIYDFDDPRPTCCVEDCTCGKTKP